MNYPLLYEINTRCWLRELSVSAGRTLTLDEVPDSEIEGWRDRGFTHIWLMGVWSSGPQSRAAALRDAKTNRSFSATLPDLRDDDVTGSPYAIIAYTVADELGGEAALGVFRRRLNAAGIALVLDYVANHTGLDHPWLANKPELFVQSPAPMPETFTLDSATPRWIAHGKDPNFPAWSDTAQLDYRNPVTRELMIAELLAISARCDGVRCDMAMLLLNDMFARNWARFPFSQPVLPGCEFWTDAIATVWRKHPDFLFVSEAYWGLESCLQTLGFNFTYDKVLYDELVYHDPSAVTRHIYEESSAAFVENSVHFIENHDEQRAASVFFSGEHRAAALLMLGLPGMRLLHEGQLTGAKTRVPVQLLRRPIEPANDEVRHIYDQLLRGLAGSAVGKGRGTILRPRAAWPDNQTWRNMVIVQWQTEPGQFDLVVVNLVPHRCQCYVPLTVPNLASHHWAMRDVLGTERYLRVGADLERQGLYLDVPAYAAQIFHFQPGG